MKNVPFLLLLIPLFLIQCTPKKEKVDIQKELSEIRTVLEKYQLANENEDFGICEEIWSTRDDIILIGTDRDEKLMGWKEIEKAIKKQHISFENTLITISDQEIRLNETGNTAWFSECLNFNFIYNEQAMSYEGIRFTGVLEKTDDRWKLVQGHLSIPADIDIAKEMLK